MPENFGANHSEDGGFWFWKKPTHQNKQKKNTLCPAKDIISQANDVVNECIIKTDDNVLHQTVSNTRKVHGVLFLVVSMAVLGVLIYYLIK